MQPLATDDLWSHESLVLKSSNIKQGGEIKRKKPNNETND